MKSIDEFDGFVEAFIVGVLVAIMLFITSLMVGKTISIIFPAIDMMVACGGANIVYLLKTSNDKERSTEQSVMFVIYFCSLIVSTGFIWMTINYLFGTSGRLFLLQ